MQKKQDPIEKNLKTVIELCYEMLEIADHGDKLRDDEGCGVVYGMLRDAAYKIRRVTEKELKKHEHRNTGVS